MTDPEKMLFEYLKNSIDNLAGKFDIFLTTQGNINEKVQENTRDISDIKEARLITTVAQHEADIKILKESKEAKFAERHPIIAQAVQFIIMVAMFIVLSHFAPGIAHLIGSI